MEAREELVRVLVYSRKSWSFCDREGCRSFERVFDSIWRTRSRLTLNSRPTFSNVRGWPSSNPNRNWMTFFSRSDSVWRTDSSCSWRRMNDAASTGLTGVGVLDEVAEVGVLLLAHGGLDGHRLLGDPEELPDLCPPGSPTAFRSPAAAARAPGPGRGPGGPGQAC